MVVPVSNLTQTDLFHAWAQRVLRELCPMKPNPQADEMAVIDVLIPFLRTATKNEVLNSLIMKLTAKPIVVTDISVDVLETTANIISMFAIVLQKLQFLWQNFNHQSVPQARSHGGHIPPNLLCPETLF